jgi:hypothetical protein
MHNHGELRVACIPESDIAKAMRWDKQALPEACFADVPVEETFDHFVAEPSGSVLAWYENVVVGCASVGKRIITFEGRPVSLGVRSNP